jgi:glycosyltransferase involved in cell wall biosynthesis
MQVVSNLKIGGAQQVVRTLAENLTRAGCDTIVCAFQDGPFRQEIEELGIPVHILPERHHSVIAFPLYIVEMIRLRRALGDLAKDYQVDVIQTHLLRSLDFLVLTLRYRTSLLVFWTIQNANFFLREDHLRKHKWLLGPKQWAYRGLYRLMVHWVNGFIAVSDEVKTSILKTIGPFPEDKITVICNSVDVRRYERSADKAEVRRRLGLSENARVMAVVATFKTQKGHRYLIEALQSVIPHFPDLHVLFIGDGELREALQSQTRNAGLGEHIHFLGFRQDIPDLLAASDCFVLPSLWEGLSMALVEAMAAGLPIVATEVSGTNQVMISGETGLLVPPGNVERLAQALTQTLSDPSTARAMGAAAQQRVEKYFGARKQAEDNISLYKREQRRAANLAFLRKETTI